VAHVQRGSQGTRYSPLAQIDASNFSTLELSWSFKTERFGPFPEYKLEGTPLMVKGVLYTTAGTRRAVIALDGRTGELIWAHSMREGKRAAVAPRQLSGRGVAYWTDGKGDERVVYVTTGYRLVSLHAKNGAPIASFGKDGVVDLKLGVVKGKGEQVDLETGEIGIHSTPVIARDIVLIGSAMREGATGTDARQHEGPGARVRRPDRPAALDLQHDPETRGARRPHLGERELGHERQRRRVDADQRRRGAGARLPAGGDAVVRLLRRASAGRQPVRREPGVRGPEDRPAQMALPARAPPDLELRHVVGADPRGRDRRREAAQGRGGAEQAGVAVRVRPRHRRARLADRGEERAAIGRPGREDREDPAASARLAPLLAQLVQAARRPGRLHAGAAQRGARAGEALPLGRDARSTPAVLGDVNGALVGAIVPGTATNWPGGGYDPENHIAFAPAANNLPGVRSIVAPPQGFSDIRYVAGFAGQPFQEVLGPGDCCAADSPRTAARAREARSDSAGATAAAPVAGGASSTTGLTVRGLPMVKPPYGLLAALDLDRGQLMWQAPHGDTPDAVRLHPALKGIDVPKTGQAFTTGVGVLVTKTLLIAGDPTITAPPGRPRGAMLRAYDKKTGRQVGEVWMPAPQSGSPMTYSVDGKQYIVVAVSGGPYSGEYLAFSLPGDGR
jgi:outer membrane protein assembly factor BamB